MRELYSYTGTVYVVRLASAIVLLHGSCLLLVAAELSELSAFAKIPFYCAAYLCLLLVIGLLLRGISHEINRMGHVSWIPTFKNKVVPLLVFTGLCGCIAQCLFAFGHLTVAKTALVLPLFIGMVLWMRILLWMYRRRNSQQIKFEKLLDRCIGLESHGDVSRLKESIRMALGRNPSVPTANQRDFVLRGLTERPWYEPDQFSWKLAFENNFAAIRKEVLDSLSSKAITPYSYPGAVVGEWNSLMLVVGNKVIEKHRAIFPTLFECLGKVPHFPSFREAQISIVKPGSRILPHRDESNLYITGQLGVQIPNNCGIDVAGETRLWTEGKFLFFSTVYEHSVWNHGDSDRIVLIVDFLHPEISDVEAKFYGPRS